MPQHRRHIAPPPRPTRPGPGRRAFSLVELLVVIGIIAVLTSLLIPGLIAARNSARKASTGALINNVTASISQYTLDNDGAPPGYFTAREMGAASNLDRAMTMNENIVLALAGERAIAEPGANPLEVGPSDDSAVNVEVDITKLGLGNSYLKLSPENLRAVDPTLQQNAAGDPAPPHVVDDSTPQMPEIVDAWERPLLIWSADQFVSPAQVTEVSPTDTDVPAFARESSADGPAVFYWNSNAGYLQGNTQQVDDSLLGANTSAELRLATMRALLGNPGYPSSLEPGNAADVYPTAARSGGLVIHSAGTDGVYLGFDDRGTTLHGEGTARAATGLEFGNNFFNGSQRLLDGEREITIDQIDDFDDVIGG